MFDYPRVIAHRCGGALAPENTLVGLSIAAQLGVRAVEFDVMLTEDGSPILIHDETLERTTNGQGRVAQTAWAEIAQLDAGSYQHRAFQNEPVPLLSVALSACSALGLAVNLEIKPAQGFEAKTGQIVAEVAAAHLPPQGLIFSSFSTDALLSARLAAPEIPRALLIDAIPADWQALLDRYGCIALHTRGHQLDTERAAAVIKSGIPLACYTVNSKLDAEALFVLGVSAVFTDRPDLLLTF